MDAFECTRHSLKVHDFGQGTAALCPSQVALKNGTPKLFFILLPSQSSSRKAATIKYRKTIDALHIQHIWKMREGGGGMEAFV